MVVTAAMDTINTAVGVADMAATGELSILAHMLPLVAADLEEMGAMEPVAAAVAAATLLPEEMAEPVLPQKATALAAVEALPNIPVVRADQGFAFLCTSQKKEGLCDEI